MHVAWQKLLVCWITYNQFSDPDPGSGAFLTPGSRIPNPHIWELSDNFLGEKFYNSLQFDPKFYPEQIKNKVITKFLTISSSICEKLRKNGDNLESIIFWTHFDWGQILKQRYTHSFVTADSVFYEETWYNSNLRIYKISSYTV